MRDLAMSRISLRRLNLFLTKLAANASSSTGLEGGLVTRKSSTGSTKPRLINPRQTRLTSARAKKGLSGCVSQSASAGR